MKHLLILVLLSCCIACSPRIHYLGDMYPPQDSIDTYYAAKDITIEHRVMGQIQNDPNIASMNIENVKKAMIEKAMSYGADGILFINFESFDNQHRVMADLIRYKD